MKRFAFIALAWLFASAATMGCSADVVDESEIATEEAEVGETQEALPLNCVGMCVAEYRACVRATRDYAGCAADREACKDVCDEQTCEPGEPGCCQGQPTCW
jgi:hypothetical protein